ncbi:unnamed protein product, partial [Parnassius apollo]
GNAGGSRVREVGGVVARGRVVARGARGVTARGARGVTARGARDGVAARGVAGGTRGRLPATRGGRQNADSAEAMDLRSTLDTIVCQQPPASPVPVPSPDPDTTVPSGHPLLDSPAQQESAPPSPALEDEDDEDPEYGEVGLPPVFLSRSETMFLGEEADEVPPTGM